VYKHKARINVHGGQQTYVVNYWETFSPVVNWFSIRLTLVLSLIYQWKTRQIDFVLAFPQADVECELDMELPRGLIFEGCHRVTHCLKLLKNLYGQKQAGRVWHEYLVEGLIERRFRQSSVDNLLLYWSNPVSQVLRAMAFKRTTRGRSNFGELVTAKIS
jgi:hypothetical protein